MAEKKKPESMLTRQRRLLREQRAKKAAAKKAQQASQKKLPSAGKTSAGKPRARYQRGMRRDALAKAQLENFGRALKKTLKQGAAADKLKKAAKGSKGKTVRTAQGKGELVKRTTNKPASQRVQRVKVKVDPPKQLKGSSPNQPKLQKAPPAKLKGSSTPKALPSAKVRPEGKPSARRAQAAARAARAAQGTTNPTVRQGQPAGAANRYYGADRVAKAVSRAQRSTLTQKALKVLGGAGKLLAGRDDGSGSALQAALLANSAIDAVRGSTAEERNNKGKTKPEPKAKSKPKSQPKPKVKYDRRGRPIKSKPVKPAKRGMSNIPPSERTNGTAETELKYGAGAPKPKRLSAPPRSSSKPSKPAPKPIPKPASKKSAASTYMEHGSKQHRGRYKTLAEHRAAVKAQKEKKKKPQTKSAANRKGWQGNQNY